MRKINVWGGMHGDEWESQAVIHDLRRRARWCARPPVRARMAHTDGHGYYREGVHNLVSAFPGSDAPDASYEQRRAAQIVRLSLGAYATIDVHQVVHHGLHTAYIDLHRGVSPLVLGFLQDLGIHNLVATDGWGVQGHVPNAFLLESRYRPRRECRERAEVVSAIRRLALGDVQTTATPAEFAWYAYSGALYVPAAYPPPDIETAFYPLQRLPQKIADAVGLDDDAVYVLNWRPPLRTGDWGEVVTPIPPPSAKNWPAE